MKPCQVTKTHIMRNQVKILVSLACMVVLCAFQCVEKEDAALPDDVVTVRVSMVASICGDAICKIEDEAYASLGQQDFEYEGKTYDGVFTTVLPCPTETGAAMTSGTGGDVFTVMISKQPFDNAGDCVRCMATFAKAPSVFYYIRPVQMVR